jgi:hypothetical protein
MKSSLHYMLALSLIAAPLSATDYTENACVVAEVTQPEQEVVQPFYKKAMSKLWEYKVEIALVSAYAVVLALGVHNYYSNQAAVAQQGLVSNAQPKATAPVEQRKIDGVPSLLKALAIDGTPSFIKSAATGVFGFGKQCAGKVYTGWNNLVNAAPNYTHGEIV